MKESYTISEELEEFSAAREQFNRLVNRLCSEETRGLAHGEVETLLWSEGMEVLRRLLQGYLDLRSHKEVRHDEVKGSDGVIRSHCRSGCRRSLMSLFGGVTVTRMGYGARGKPSLFPLDGELNLPLDKYSHGLRRRVAEEVSRHSFDEAVASIEKTTGGHVPKRQTEMLSVEIAQGFEGFYAVRQSDGLEPTRDPLVLSVDGKGIVMRKEGLRQATQKAAERDGRKLKTRLCRGEKANRKRMATVATVYSIAPHLRTAETIMGLEEDTALKPRARDKRVWASVEHASTDVIEQVCLMRRWTVTPSSVALGSSWWMAKSIS